ncbi:hypothetical protein B0G93_1245 [Bacillus sp. V-88]|uniref:Uncharacterized protein n=1 Tax=Rossellomorea vietnamensis TaxID=218284 RepID=A0A6I6UR32_9BACI|nr:hypothetical protein [Rossellomorea vietnamensis]OXS56020.1 hypothetical protein B1B00_17850 [Bacillus sp. DSM 27956]PRX71750.1 hypothetical protein B0G93_1245 [Bacillus sp. V-88]QHE61363.1 hypothetical protein FHE72_10220 [Rossellomorea vietnamensis]SLK24386.1 hypothetical protein SAMN06295884_1245 [Bacillus sp. V-88]
MKKRKQFRGSQTPTPSPSPIPLDTNDLAPECIRVDKVYDWVFFANKYENKNFIPDEACRAAVSAALAAGQRVEVQTAPVNPADVSVSGSIIENGNPGKVLIVWTVPVDVTILINGVAECSFTVRTQFTDEIMLCVPVGITNDNLNIRATQVIATSGGVLMGPDPFGPMIPLKVVLCKDVQVEYPVKLEVLAKFCFPRPNNIPVPEERLQCDLSLLEFPRQCPGLFPVANCECQATALARNEDTIATFGSGGTADEVTGLSTLRAEICQECSLADSTWSYSFTDTEVGPTPAPTATGFQPDFSFTFDPSSIDRVTCGDDALTAVGEGIRYFDGAPEQLFYELQIFDAPTEGFRLILRNTANVVIFDSGVVDALVEFGECETFADLLGDLDD